MAKSESSDRVNMACVGSKKTLEVLLSRLKGFKGPKVRAEQYVTEVEIAAEVLWNAFMKGNIGKVSVDLGCGPGMLGIGLLALGAQKVYFVDFDEHALDIARDNLEKVQSEGYMLGEAVFVCTDVSNFNEPADLVVMNPPFGVKVRHMDQIFLKKAFDISKIVYSFHKTESKQFLDSFSKDNGFKITEVFDFNFPLKATMSHHTHRIKRIGVSCFRFEKLNS